MKINIKDVLMRTVWTGVFAMAGLMIAENMTDVPDSAQMKTFWAVGSAAAGSFLKSWLLELMQPSRVLKVTGTVEEFVAKYGSIEKKFN